MVLSFFIPAIILLFVLVSLLKGIKITYRFRLENFAVEQALDVQVFFIRKNIDIGRGKGQPPDLSALREYIKIARRAIANTDVKQLDASMDIGLDDAFLTVMACGAAQTIGSMALFYLLPHERINFREHVNVRPSFGRECLDINLNCILLTNIANIIEVIGKIQLSKRSDKIASHRKHDENDHGRNTGND